ncbi:MAG: type II toxin-antitoxin system prevent-host-death family antitoxin [Deltaproteobacteria bacterium]|nr:type II toxin-antitoxin system prevent-host-death family antitoxin [Deltaproteobacteria bacterium]
MVVNIHEAKTHLSKILEAVQRGEEVIIAKANTPIAEIIPFDRPALQLGGFEATIDIRDDFDSEAVNDEVARIFEGTS